jgi:hypothetical protein
VVPIAFQYICGWSTVAPPGDRFRADPRLGHRRVAVDELPGADFQPAAVQFVDQGAVELVPAGGAIAGLDVDGADAVAFGGGDDRRHAAALRLVDVPDPHPLADERRVAADARVFELAGAAGFGAGGGGKRERGDREREGHQQGGEGGDAADRGGGAARPGAADHGGDSAPAGVAAPASGPTGNGGELHWSSEHGHGGRGAHHHYPPRPGAISDGLATSRASEH